ncbi:RS1 [Branchiostoma lanceolatum]|uniref:RS1 protein n=1 Tax=Branchiostoma lanceolatum TaxID=7740 RepID=A0A8K0F3Z5_BRALA|nr:RS1 [Branchiostoma lanceolatum]
MCTCVTSVHAEEIKESENKYLLRYEEDHGIRLARDSIKNNPGLRALSKLCLNFLWASPTLWLLVELEAVASTQGFLVEMEAVALTRGLLVELEAVASTQGLLVELEAVASTQGLLVELEAVALTQGLLVEMEAVALTQGLLVELEAVALTQGLLLEMEAVALTQGLLVEMEAVALTQGLLAAEIVDLGELVQVTGFITQGRPQYTPEQYVTEYTVYYSTDGINFIPYNDDTNTPVVFTANTDITTAVTNLVSIS